MTNAIANTTITDKKAYELILQYYDQLEAMNTFIAARKERPWPTKEELSVTRQLTGTIRVLKAKSAMILAMEAIMRFTNNIRRSAPDLAAQLLPQLCILLFPGIELNIEELTTNAAPAKKPTTTTKPQKAATNNSIPGLTRQYSNPPTALMGDDPEVNKLLADLFEEMQSIYPNGLPSDQKQLNELSKQLVLKE